MKKFSLIILVVLALCLLLASCGKDNPTPTQPTVFPESPVHVHIEEIIPAVDSTCTSTGLTEGTKCSECGEILVAQEITPLAPHTEEIVPSVDPSCTQEGLTEGKKCSVCEKILLAQTEVVKIAHTYDDKYDEICNKCGFIRDAECAHLDFNIIPAKDPTCVEPGLTEGRVCSKCEEILVAQQIITPSAHTFSNSYDYNYTHHWKKCDVCGAPDVKMEHVIYNGVCSECGIIEGSTIGVLYEVKDGAYAKVIGYKGSETKVEIASKYMGVPVTNIYRLSSNLITELTIPESITSIGYCAINCENLTKINMTNMEVDIDEYALDCPKLTTVYNDGLYIKIGDNPYAILYDVYKIDSGTYEIHEDTEIISQNAFYDFRSELTNITILDSVKWIGSYAFGYCTELKTVILGDGIEKISDYAFYDCSSLTSVILGENLTEIGRLAFWRCRNLQSIDLPATLVSIEYGAFELTGLKSIVIPDNVVNIGSHAFSSCGELTSVIMGDRITVIENWTFFSCSKLKEIRLSNNIKSIGFGAFVGCKSLVSITFPKSITSIGERAFDNCDYSLKNIYYCGTEEEWNKVEIATQNGCFEEATIHYNYVSQ